MANPYIGEIRMLGCNFQISGWAFCNGQLLAIAQNNALFALIGTTYGGDGVSTFGLPDLRSRVPVGLGQGTGLSSRVLGQNGGTETVTLTPLQIPSHTHTVACSTGAPDSATPANSFWAANSNTGQPQFAAAPDATGMNPGAILNAGGNQPHNNIMPYLAINFLISLFGIFPSQN